VDAGPGGPLPGVLDLLTLEEGTRMGALKIVTDATFADDVLMSEKPVLVDFWAEWCGPCKMITPVLEEIAGTTDKIEIVKVNVDENPGTGANERIMSLPTLNLYQGGRVVKQIVGARPKAAILADLAEYL
jgi:thioredoxin 1